MNTFLKTFFGSLIGFGFYTLISSNNIFKANEGTEIVTILLFGLVGAVTALVFHKPYQGKRVATTKPAETHKTEPVKATTTTTSAPPTAAPAAPKPVSKPAPKPAAPDTPVVQKPAEPKSDESKPLPPDPEFDQIWEERKREILGKKPKDAPKDTHKEKPKSDERGPSSDALITPVMSDIRFSDIAGYENTKKSIAFMVSCLKNTTDLNALGARLPKGMLLSGPPGTGKTFMAKAIAGEAGVPFFSVSGSSFMDIYVGQGPRNIRALFEAARGVAPCVVFIDELDAIGGARDQGDTNSERRNTLNALLVEMDGMTQNSGILTIGATNTPDELDRALVRPGRFDRKVYMPLPDQAEREAILAIHCRNKVLAEDVDFKKLAASTPGFAGAGLATLANEAALMAAFNHHNAILADDFEKALFQIIMEGEPKENRTPEEKRMVAFHEGGHTMAIKMLAKEPVPKVTIIGSTSGAGGVTFRADNGKKMMSKSAMENQIMVAYAGRAAEEIFFGNPDDVTTGASSDIRQATSLIRQYLTVYGMSKEMGMLNMDILTGRGSGDQEMVDEARQLSNDLYQKVLSFLRENEDKLTALADALVEKDTLFDDDLNEILGLESN